MKRFRLLAMALVVILAMVSAFSADKKKYSRVVFASRLTKGQVVRFQSEFHSTTKTSTTSVIVSPVTATNAELSVSVTLRIEVLDVQPSSGGADARMIARLRTTYEHVTATSRSDDPARDDAEIPRAIAALEGKSFECTMSGAGGVRDCTGIAALAPGASNSPDALGDLFAQVFAADTLPEKGIAPGEKWGAEQAIGAAIPLEGLRWVRESRYLRDEPCFAEDRAAHAQIPVEICAVIQTRSLLTREGARKDPTPEALREKNLRTEGFARGASEVLLRISQRTGLTVGATQSGWQSSDVAIMTADGARKVRSTADLKTESNLTIVRDPR